MSNIFKELILFAIALAKNTCKVGASWQIAAPYGSRLHIPPTIHHLLAAQQATQRKPISW